MAQTDILNKIKRIRKEQGLSQTDMAEALHIALKTYQNIEGGITRIDLERLTQIADILGTSLSNLLGHGESDTDVTRFINEEKALYNKIIHDKEAYIVRLEENIRFYQEILRDQHAF